MEDAARYGITRALRLALLDNRIKRRTQVMEFYEGVFHILKSYRCGFIDIVDEAEKDRVLRNIKKAILGLKKVHEIARLHQDIDIAEYKRINIEIDLEEEPDGSV